MSVNITTKHFHLRDNEEPIYLKKIMKLERYFQQNVDIQAKLSVVVKNQLHKAEITLFADGTVIRAEESGDEMLACVEQAIRKIEKQIARNKTRIAKKLHQNNLFAENMDFDFRFDEEPEAVSIVRTKRFALKPMDAEEASLQMGLLGHNFYVYRNDENGQVNVVYRRRDGTVGLIEPDTEE